MKPRVIAFYLPQYHPFPENDLWWGRGFTEWTNVKKAKSLFPGHVQPKIPADLGYYDLRNPDIRELQAVYARQAGIEGFCYYHYWFGDKELMSFPFDEMVNSGSPGFPFCLCWANESWHNKFWNHEGESKKRLLIEQKYPGKEDHERHFYRLLKAFSDSRYMREDGRLVFMIYNPFEFPRLEEFISLWQELAKKNGLPGFYFIAYTTSVEDIPSILRRGFDAVNYNRLPTCIPARGSFSYFSKVCKMRIFHIPIVINYRKAICSFDGPEDENDQIIPSLIPNWDHTPRSGYHGYLLHQSSPELFREHVKRVFGRMARKKNQLVFLKSWNEWGEGNYMEPDIEFGCQYIDVLGEEVNRVSHLA